MSQENFYITTTTTVECTSIDMQMRAERVRHELVELGASNEATLTKPQQIYDNVGEFMNLPPAGMELQTFE